MASSTRQLTPDDIFRLTKLLREAEEKWMFIIMGATKSAFTTWKTLMLEEKRKRAAANEKVKIIEIMKTSIRGKRNIMEKDAIRKFIVNHMTCIPSKELSFSEIDKLCNEVDWFHCVGRSIVFLQGDFGNCYYMVASGVVSLYVESSKDREMVLGREYGKLRGQPLPPDFDLEQLGRNVFNLPQGGGFGEFAILSTTQKLRSAAAVTTTDDSLLFIMHGETYDACLRKFHFRQRALSSATKLLQGLPLFNYMSFSKISQVAYTMKSLTYTNHSTITAAGQPIKSVFLIAAGQVKVFAVKENSRSKNPVVRNVENRIPALAVCLLGPGQIIGSNELKKSEDKFEMTYVGNSSLCELFEMPLTVYIDHLTAPALKTSRDYLEAEEIAAIMEANHKDRISRTSRSVRVMMSAKEGEAQRKKDELLAVLPCIMEEPGFHCKGDILADPTAAMSASVGGRFGFQSSQSQGGGGGGGLGSTLVDSSRSHNPRGGTLPGFDDLNASMSHASVSLGQRPSQGSPRSSKHIRFAPETVGPETTTASSPAGKQQQQQQHNSSYGANGGGSISGRSYSSSGYGHPGKAAAGFPASAGWSPSGKSDKSKTAGAIRSFIERQINTD